MVWIDVHNGMPSFNTNTRRAKARNLRRDPRVIVSIQNPENPQQYALLRGTATVSEQDGVAQINKLAKKYLGADQYPNFQPGEVRVSVDIALERVGGSGPWAP